MASLPWNQNQLTPEQRKTLAQEEAKIRAKKYYYANHEVVRAKQNNYKRSIRHPSTDSRDSGIRSRCD